MTSETYIPSPPIPEYVLRQKYLADYLSTTAIAREFSCSSERIRRLLLKYKISLRTGSQCQKVMWNTYGKQKVGGKVVDHESELRTIAAIKKMYGEGQGATAIAKFLNTRKIPTKQRGGNWYKCTITNILKREGVYVKKRWARRRRQTAPSAST